MAVKIRLARYGAKNKPFYRIVAADTRSPRDGRHLEILGTYDPMNLRVANHSSEKKEKGIVQLRTDRLEHWKKNGAQLSPTVKDILHREGMAS